MRRPRNVRAGFLWYRGGMGVGGGGEKWVKFRSDPSLGKSGRVGEEQGGLHYGSRDAIARVKIFQINEDILLLEIVSPPSTFSLKREPRAKRRRWSLRRLMVFLEPYRGCLKTFRCGVTVRESLYAATHQVHHLAWRSFFMRTPYGNDAPE